jgi:hypothetical protein
MTPFTDSDCGPTQRRWTKGRTPEQVLTTCLASLLVSHHFGDMPL